MHFVHPSKAGRAFAAFPPHVQLSKFGADLFQPIPPALVLGSLFGSDRFSPLPIQAVDEMDSVHFLAQRSDSCFLLGIDFHNDVATTILRG